MSKKLAAMLKQNTRSGFVSGLEGVPEAVEEVQPSPAPTHQYLPTTTSFSGANKCYVCDKTVYKTEEIIAVGKVWHNTCFTCGGLNKDGCGRTMKRDGYVDHDSQPYCNACYNKLFKTKGFGIGTGLNTDFGQNKSSNSIEVPPAPASPVNVEPARASPTPAATVGSSNHYTPGGFQGVGSAAKLSSSTPSPASSATKPEPKRTPSSAVAAATSQTPKCTACAKSVYKAEELIAVSRVWHITCFTCGGTNTKGEGCKKVLKRDQYVDHENQPFCNACHAKLFKPKGFGYGNTLSTDYGPTADVTAGVSKLNTRDSSPPPPAPAASTKPATSFTGGSFQGVGSVASQARSPTSASAPAPPAPRSVSPVAPPAAPAVAPPAPAPPAAAEPVPAPARRPSASSGFQGMAAAAAAPKPAAPAPPAAPATRRPSAPAAPPVATTADDEDEAPSANAPARRPSGVSNVAPFSEESISKFKQPAKRPSLNIGKSDALHKEAGYVGDNDEVDESEW